MLVSHQERPRDLKWYHAGPLLYGDLGTSRFYVLGLAFFFALYSSIWYVLAVGVLVAGVGWAYTIVCRAFPDGGGVYSAARQVSPLLSVIGAALLFADYAVTAALSSFEGFRYFGLPATTDSDKTILAFAATGAIVFLGLINFVGAKRAGTFALIVASATVVTTLILVGFSVPHLAEGFSHIQSVSGTPYHQWRTLVFVVLALSGVEAVSNMTGIMVPPVEKTSRRAIWPVLAEVIIFNLVLGIALLAIRPGPPQGGHQDFMKPAHQYEEEAQDTERLIANAKELGAIAQVTKLEARLEELKPSKHETDVRDRVLREMGEQFVGDAMGSEKMGRIWGAASGFIFGLLLISAVNTVLGGMISVQYVMARDGELPRLFNKLNMFGVPWVGLIPAVLIPACLLMIFSSLDELADLYAIGVVGAIAINLTSCTLNAKLPIKKWERLLMGLLAAIMAAIEMTLAVEKIHALIFAIIIVGGALVMRWGTKHYVKVRARRRAMITPGIPVMEGIPASEMSVADLVPTEKLATPPEELDMTKPHIMVATRGGQRLIDFAANYTHRFNGIMFVLFVRQLNLAFGTSAPTMVLEEDREARLAFQSAADACKKAGVQMIPIYAVSPDVAYTILDFAATYNVEGLLMGVSRKGTLLRALQGDVITNVADNLPPDIPLLIHA